MQMSLWSTKRQANANSLAVAESKTSQAVPWEPLLKTYDGSDTFTSIEDAATLKKLLNLLQGTSCSHVGDGADALGSKSWWW